MPALVLLGPLAIAFPIGWAYLYKSVWPEAELGVLSRDADLPGGFILGWMLLLGVSGFITTIGLSSVIVAANSAAKAKALPLAQSLDPAFTRMGGLLLLWLIVATLTVLSSVPPFFMAFFLLRYGLIFHIFMLEDVNTARTLRRGWTILRGRLTRFFSLCLSIFGLTVLTSTVFAFIVASIIQLATLPFTGDVVSRDTNILIGAIMAGATWLGMIPLLTFFTTLTTVFYLKAREETPA